MSLGQQAATNVVTNALRLLTGKMLAVFGPNNPQRIATATATIGIRGTGVYAEADPDTCDCVADPNKEDCDTVHDLQEIWDGLNLEDFGLEGVRIDHPVMGITEDDLLPVRYLTFGTGITFDLTE